MCKIKITFSLLLLCFSFSLHAGSAENIIKATELMIEKASACSDELREMGFEMGFENAIKNLGGKRCLNFAYGMFYYEAYKNREIKKVTKYEWGKYKGEIKNKIATLKRYVDMHTLDSDFKEGLGVFEKLK